tara:strand:- start:5258 stop:5620 length:363 start_codon:yes stop_codon:yes gene_type:complete
MDNEWLDEFPPLERLSIFIAGELADDEDNLRFEELSKSLGYANSTIPNRWMHFQSKIPLKHISGIAKFFDRDIADLLPLWVLQELPDDIDLYQSASRILSAKEHWVISVAREVYLGYVED